MPSPSTPTMTDCNCRVMRQASRTVTAFYDRHLAPAGLRISQFGILATLKHKGPLTINELAAELILDRTTLGRNILPLQRDGLITVKASASDRRSKELSLSSDGEKIYREARKYWLEAQTEFEATFGDKRAFDLRVLLKDIVTGEVGASTAASLS